MRDDPIDAINPMPKDDRKERDERIRRRAFEIWEAAGRPEGQQAEHWLAAEREDASQDNSEPSLGSPVQPGMTIPDVRSPSHAGVRGADGDEAAPKTSGAPQPAPDTSESPIANRDTSGSRKAGATPRPTTKPLG